LPYYWVGGAGSWSDFENHWATSSEGNVFHTSAPGLSNDVFFDINSGFDVAASESNMITIDANAICRDIIWSDVPDITPILAGPDHVKIQIYGNVKIETTIDNRFPGIFEFNASGPKTIAVTSPFNNGSTVVFNNPNGKWTLQERLNVNNIIIQDGELEAVNYTITVRGNWTVVNAATAKFTSGIGKVVFEGTSNQNPQIISTNSAAGNEFYEVIIDNRGVGIVLNSPVYIGKNDGGGIVFSDGIVVSNILNILTLNNKATAFGAKDESHVNGYVKKIGGDGNGEFLFPIGDGIHYRPAGLQFLTPNPSSQTIYTAKYINRREDIKYPPQNATSPLTITRNEYWEIEKDGSAGQAARVILSWIIPVSGPVGYYGNPDLADASKLLVCSWNADDPFAGNWIDRNTTDHNITNDETATYQGTLITNAQVNHGVGSRIWAIGSKEIPLPIELLYFRVQVIGDAVQFNWATASEKDNEYFTIEKSQDAVNFTEVTRKIGAGNMQEIRKYTATDHNPYNGVTYYRLK
jgi:hypothetical protein